MSRDEEQVRSCVGDAAAKDAATAPKSIVLFSDGTGNSSAKLFKTNVWRLYEAVDLGPSPGGNRDQISFYDDGVGTSNFKFLAALGGAFGWGLKRNVLDIYRYASRNYREGDHIYAFGFSRGAFTIRLVVALIASQGLVQSEDESELNRKSIQAYRAFREAFHIRKFKRWTKFLRRMRNRTRTTTYDSTKNTHPKIHFVGVWDTVAAYGGPIAEITRAIDNWIYPLSMPNYVLDEKVECARHALAIDDERDAFQPLLWDELAEEKRALEAKNAQQAALEKARRSRSKTKRAEWLGKAAGRAADKRFFRTRLQQVWFTGMHADVGGGYPDESLSYVSLLWMMEEAETTGLRVLPSIKDRFFALANSYGPMHDSRSGFAAYYRYQPRKIAAWLDSTGTEDDCRYLMLRDPDVEDDNGNVRGLLRCVCVHESVIARINSGTVRYAPIALPEAFKVMPPQRAGETVQQPTAHDGFHCKYERPPSEPLITPEIRALVEQRAAAHFDCQENLWDFVWRRRIAYFATVIATVLLVVLPFWNPLPGFIDRTCSDSRCVIPSLIRPARALVPGFVDPWISAVARYPITPFIYIVAIVLLLKWSTSIERQLSDGSYRLWRRVLDGQQIESCKPTRLREIREGATYQSLFQWLKWSVLPAVFGFLMFLAILYVPLVGISQAAIQLDEADHTFCAADDPNQLHQLVGDRKSFAFFTWRRCNPTNLIIDTNQPYEIVFQLPVSDKGDPVPWWDDTIASKPGSITRVRASSLFQVLGVPMRRVIEASYLQPLAQTAALPRPPRHWWERFDIHRVHVTKLELKQDEDWPELYRTRFVLRSKNDEKRVLHLFANDVHLPFAGTRFYDNNCGSAVVTIIKIVPRKRGQPAQDQMAEPGLPLHALQCSKDPRREDLLKATAASAP
jgi:uncharacterized protein (DUF2235 family)